MNVKMSPQLLLVLVIFCTVAVSACQQKKPLVVANIVVDRLSGFEVGNGLASERVEQIAADIIRQDSNIRMAREGEDGAALRIRLERWDLHREQGENVLMVGVKYFNRTESGLHPLFGAARVRENGPRGLIGGLSDAIRESIRQVLSEEHDGNETVDVLLTYLNRYELGIEMQPEKLLHAIDVLGAKKERRAVKALCDILLARDQRLARAALQALAQIGDPAAVPAVTQFAERKSVRIRRQVIFALQEMGGADAAAWLFTMSTGHDDPEVRALAEEALKVVEQKLGKFR